VSVGLLVWKWFGWLVLYSIFDHDWPRKVVALGLECGFSASHYAWRG